MLLSGLLLVKAHCERVVAKDRTSASTDRGSMITINQHRSYQLRVSLHPPRLYGPVPDSSSSYWPSVERWKAQAKTVLHHTDD